MKVTRTLDELTPEFIEKLQKWFQNQHRAYFYEANDEKSKEFALKLHKIQSVTTMSDIENYGVCRDNIVIRYGELFLCDSKHAGGKFCVCQHIKGKKHHKVILELTDTNHYKNYIAGYFAVPFL